MISSTGLELSEEGRSLTWDEWKRIGGCSFCNLNFTVIAQQHGTTKIWSRKKLTLGELTRTWKPAERELARFARKNILTDS